MKSLIVLVIIALLGVGGYFGYQMMVPKEAPARDLIVGTDATYPPLESLDSQGKIVGFDIDLASEIGKAMKAKIEYKNVVFDDIFSELEQGKIDMIVSSVTITPERAAKYAFSAPYFNAGQVMVVRKDSLIKSVAEVKGKVIGAQADTTSLTEAKKMTESKLVRQYADYKAATADLVSKKIDAIFIDLPAGVGLVGENDQLVIVGNPFTQEFYGMVVRKGDEALLSKVNAAITTLKQSGKLSEIQKRWKL